DLLDPFVARRHAERRVAAHDAEHLAVPLALLAVGVAAEDAEPGRMGRDLEPLRQLDGAARALDLLGHVERDADEFERFAAGVTPHDAARQHMTPAPVAAPVAR